MSKNLSILIVPEWFPTVAAPYAGRFIYDQARALSARHHLTVLYCPLVLAKEEATSVIKGDSFETIVEPLLPKKGLFQWSYAQTIRRHLLNASAKYDIIHAHVAIPTGLASVTAGRLSGVQTVITEHSGPFSILMKTGRNRFKVRLANALATKIVAVSDASASEIRSYGLRVDTVISNLVDTKLFSCESVAGNVRTTIKLLFAGRLDDQQKGLTYLLEAMSLLMNTNNIGMQYELSIIGSGRELAASKDVARKLGVERCCEFLGTLTHEAVAKEMSKCDIYVSPSLYESFGVTLIEAIASGKPVVATRCGGPEEIVTTETGVLVEPKSAGALAKAIADVAGNLSRYNPKCISEHARNKYGFDAVVDQLEELYEEAMGKKSL